ncbi:MAG: penicillin-insensitive murein endopeptidase, partial [Bdellovibrio sp.]
YHHQVEAQQEAPAVNKAASPTTTTPAPGEPLKGSASAEDEEGEDDEDGAEATQETEEKEVHGGSDYEETPPAPYIGSVKEDIRNILDIKPEGKSGGSSPGNNVVKEVPPKDSSPKEAPAQETPGQPKKEPPPKPKEEAPQSEPPQPDKPGKKNPEDPSPQPQTPVAPVTEPESIRQVIGAVNGGRLENPVNLLEYEKKHTPAGFTIRYPKEKRYYGSNELAYIVKVMGEFTKKEIPDYVLPISDLSKKKGGYLSPHKSHQNGLDVDVAYYFDNPQFQGHFPSAVVVNKTHGDWMAETQWKLFKHLVQTGFVNRILVHSVLKKSLCAMAIKSGEIKKGQKQGLAFETLARITIENNHNNHFHLRVRCSSVQQACLPPSEPKADSGCF